MRAAEVFTPGKLPQVTYVDHHLLERGLLLQDTLEAGAHAITLSGPSKSGKTVFVEKQIGKDRLIQVTGAGVTCPEDLWDRVFTFIGTPLPERTTTSSGRESGISGEVSGGVPFAAQAAAATSTSTNASTSVEAVNKTDHLQLLIKELSSTGLVVFIDDFHYIPKPVQSEISNQIKEAIRSDVTFIIASVPYHSDDAVRANSDLRGRAVKIDFNYWAKPDLKEIALRGFKALEIDIPEAYIDALSEEAAGSPQLMQSLCLNTCFELQLREKQPSLTRVTAPFGPLIPKVCSRTATTADYSSTVSKMKEGPKTRGQDRNGHLLKTGEILDVYPLILKAISSNPPELTIRYQNLQGRISSLCAKDSPSGSSVTGACAHMCAIANASEARNVVEWDGESDVLDIRDPYLLFFIRWGG